MGASCQENPAHLVAYLRRVLCTPAGHHAYSTLSLLGKHVLLAFLQLDLVLADKVAQFQDAYHCELKTF